MFYGFVTKQMMKFLKKFLLGLLVLAFISLVIYFLILAWNTVIGMAAILAGIIIVAFMIGGEILKKR